MTSTYMKIEAYALAGRFGEQHVKDVQDAGLGDVPIPERVREEMAYYAQKRVQAALIQAISTPEQEVTASTINQSLCQHCRSIFDGTGEPAPCIFPNDCGPYYVHLTIEGVRESMESGCGMCLLIYNSISEAHSTIDGRCLPGRYEYATFMTHHGQWDVQPEIFALRLHYAAVAASQGGLFALPSVTITLDRSNDLQALPNRVLKSPSTGSEESFEQARQWLNRCRELGSCSRYSGRSTKYFLPTRLLDVSPAEDKDKIRLVSSEDLPSDALYCTLSYYPYSLEQLTTYLTAANLGILRKSISIYGIDRVFVDAVAVTRNLKTRYLWIDALCVIQDSDADQTHEASLRAEYYSNSTLNISGTAPQRLDKGLFRHRKTCKGDNSVAEVLDNHHSLPSGHYRFYNESAWVTFVDDVSLSKRPWSYQERLLSPRILHFTKHELFWECHCLQASEEYAEGLPKRYHLNRDRKAMWAATTAICPTVEHWPTVIQVWNEIIAVYTLYEHTQSEQKLQALYNIAKQLCDIKPNVPHNQLIGGLWLEGLLYQLLWMSAGNTNRGRTSPAPSWSWASVQGRIVPSLYGLDFSRIGILRQPSSLPPVRGPNTLLANFTVRPIAKTLSLDTDSGNLRLLNPLLPTALHIERGPAYEPVCYVSLNTRAGAVSYNPSRWPPHAGMSTTIHQHVSGYDFSIPLPGGHHSGVGRLDFPCYEYATLEDLVLAPLLAVHRVDQRTGKVLDVEKIVGIVLRRLEMGAAGPGGEEGKEGVFERVGVFKFEENAVIELLCFLAALPREAAECLGCKGGNDVRVEDFAFDAWYALQLDWLPRCYRRWEAVIV